MNTIDLIPTGDPAKDLPALKLAIQDIEPGGTIWLHTKPTFFDLGAGTNGIFVEPDDVVYLEKNVTLAGGNENHVVDPGDPAVIRNGTQIMWGRDPDTHAPVPISATITNIRFEGFRAGAIRIWAAAGKSEISYCSFEDYKQGTVVGGTVIGAFPILSGNAKQPALLTGTLVVDHCHFGKSIPVPGGMNNMVHIDDALMDVDITNNTVEDMNWIGFAVWGIAGHTRIVGNTITMKTWYRKQPQFGIAFGGRTNLFLTPKPNWDGKATIENNRITIDPVVPAGQSYLGAYGISVMRFDETGEYNAHDPAFTERDIVVRNNVIEIRGSTVQGAGLACLGACSQSTWTGNVVSGSGAYGIRMSTDMPANLPASAGSPSGNAFENNQLTPFTAGVAQVYVASGAAEFSFVNNAFGPVLGSNEYPPPLPEPCAAGIACFGSDGQLVLNDFSTSGIQGWIGAPYVGCIYLSGARKNHVRFVPAEFPAGTFPPPARQILDLAKGNVVEQVELPEEVLIKV